LNFEFLNVDSLYKTTNRIQESGVRVQELEAAIDSEFWILGFSLD